MNKNESKYFNTAVKMNKALISLLEKKEFVYITIKEICEAAGVNRSTFYLHYENTADLLQETTQHILEDFLSYFNVDKERMFTSSANCDLNDLVFINSEYLVPYLTFIRENRKLFKTAMQNIETMGFKTFYDTMFQNVFRPILTRFHYSEIEQSYVMKFYLSGITAIVMEWINNDCDTEIECIIQIIKNCIYGKNENS